MSRAGTKNGAGSERASDRRASTKIILTAFVRCLFTYYNTGCTKNRHVRRQSLVKLPGPSDIGYVHQRTFVCEQLIVSLRILECALCPEAIGLRCRRQRLFKNSSGSGGTRRIKGRAALGAARITIVDIERNYENHVFQRAVTDCMPSADNRVLRSATSEVNVVGHRIDKLPKPSRLYHTTGRRRSITVVS